MIQSTQEQELVLTTNTSPITFSDTDLRTASANCFNGWLNHNEGSATFNILAGGIYEITFNANITSATAGIVGLAIYADGVKLNGTEMDEVITTAGDYKNVAVNKKIRVCGRGNVTITIQSVPAIKQILEEEDINANNIDNICKLAKIKHLAKEDENMRYSDYNDYGRRPGFGSYGDYGYRDYGRRGYDSKYRGYGHLDRMSDQYGRYEDYRGRYGTNEDTKQSLKQMLESMEDFARMLKEEAQSQEEVEMIRQTAQRIAQM